MDMPGMRLFRRPSWMRDVPAQFGGMEVVTTDAPSLDWRDPYHALLAIG